MERFNTTSKGYRFDKFIFWGVAGVLILTVAVIIFTNGISFKPYFKCNDLYGQCDNPFYTAGDVQCKIIIGLKDCPVEKAEWMTKPTLPYGEYGEKPKSFLWFEIMIIILFALAFLFNHFVWNGDKDFHINMMDKIKKDDEEEKNV